jgi:hypothetical protein
MKFNLACLGQAVKTEPVSSIKSNGTMKTKKEKKRKKQPQSDDTLIQQQ